MRHLFLFSVLVCLAGCADRSFTPVTPEALAVGTPYTVFAATTRAQESDGSFGFDRSKDLSLLELTVSIPPMSLNDQEITRQVIERHKAE